MRPLAALVLLLVAGCDSADSIAAVDQEASVAVTSEAQLVAAQAAWRASGIADYTFEYVLECFCAPGERVTVRSGRAVRTTRGDVAEARTIDRLFDEALSSLRTAESAEMYEARVRLSAGTPQIPILLEEGTTDPRIADGFSRLVVTGFERR